MNLMDLVAASERVAATAGRNDKANQLADVLRRIDRSEIPFAVASLSGRTRQGRIGIGYAAIRAALDAAIRPDRSAEPSH